MGWNHIGFNIFLFRYYRSTLVYLYIQLTELVCFIII